MQLYEFTPFMTEAFQTEVNLRRDIPASQASSNVSFTNATSAVLIAAMVLFTWLYVPWLVRRLNRSMKSNRALLVLLPADVVAGGRVLRAMVTSWTKKLV